MKTSWTHAHTTDHTSPARVDREPVGIWMSREPGEDSPTTVELLGLDGTVTTVVQHSDGTVEIRTDAMSESGQAVRVAPTGSAHTFAH